MIDYERLIQIVPTSHIMRNQKMGSLAQVWKLDKGLRDLSPSHLSVHHL